MLHCRDPIIIIMEHKQISENIGYCDLVSLFFFFFQWVQCHFWRNISCLVKEEFVFIHFLPLINDNEVCIISLLL